MSYHISNNAVAVDTEYFWQPMTSCPSGVKVQLLGEGGVAAYGTWDGKTGFWQGWAPLPKRRPLINIVANPAVPEGQALFVQDGKPVGVVTGIEPEAQEQRAQAAINSVAIPPDFKVEWPSMVRAAFVDLRIHNSTIPNHVLDAMRDILLAAK